MALFLPPHRLPCPLRVVLALIPLNQALWSGPELRLLHTQPGNFPALQLAPQGINRSTVEPGLAASTHIAGELLPPFWLNLNNQGYPNISAITVQIIRAREAGLQLLAVVLSDDLVVPPVAGPTKQIMALVQEHHPTAKLLVRWYLSRAVGEHPEWEMVLQNISNPAQNTSTDAHDLRGMSSPTTAWANEAAANLSTSLAHLDASFPGKIAGVVLEGLETGEWFLPPSDPVGMMAGDYAQEMRTEFCAAHGGDGDCHLPTAQERNNATLGNALLQWRHSLDASARSFHYNRFISQKVASAVSVSILHYFPSPQMRPLRSSDQNCHTDRSPDLLP